jgi:prepilin-type N-terminal cleavage/methylation domain-containing protein
MSAAPSYRGGCKLPRGRAAVPPRFREESGDAGKRSHRADESGFTIIELLLSVLILSIIIGLSTSTVRMFYTQSADVQNTFAVTNQVLLASEVLTEYTHDGVASCPGPTATPSDSACNASNGEYPFVTATSTSATFFADTDDVSGTNGPVKVSISLTGTVFAVTVTQPNSSGCPLTSTQTATPATVCSYTTNAPRTLVSIPDETNASPLAYLIAVTGQQTGGTCNSTEVANPGTTGNPAPITQIAALCISLNVQVKGGQQAGYQSLAYMLSPGYTVNAG